jgi:hypothetical protein
MIPGNLPFTLRQGESFGQEIYFKYEDKSSYPLTGCTAKMDVRTNPGAEAIVKICSGDGITIDEEEGSIYIEIDKTVTATLKPGSYVYDLFITDGGGIAKPFLAGSFNIAAGITQ